MIEEILMRVEKLFGLKVTVDMNCRKDLHEIFCISTSRVSLCWVKKATQQAD